MQEKGRQHYRPRVMKRKANTKSKDDQLLIE